MTEVNRDYPWDLDAVVPLEADGGWGGVAAAGKVLKHEKKKQRKRFERPMFSNPYIIQSWPLKCAHFCICRHFFYLFFYRQTIENKNTHKSKTKKKKPKKVNFDHFWATFLSLKWAP